MSAQLTNLLIRYNKFMGLCEEFHTQSGNHEVEVRLIHLATITASFNELHQADLEAGELLSAEHYLGLLGQMKRISRRFG